MKNAKPSVGYLVDFYSGHKKGEPIDTIVRLEDGGFERFQQTFRWAVTDDISYGNQIKHYEYYPEETINDKYDSEGRLKARTKKYGSTWTNDIRKSVSKAYEPPGTWIGNKKKVE